ncbi:7TM diverse intracellular signalling [Pseudobacteriovorax antillogorgiicola]|uniref:histidine kinase n=3 Tax=Pseudobacteriovorax antillogorgiicola TaxID=1513793 RepID=A0A1Y6CEM2_9BACT|nr:7TM protein involved in diverse intracellular signaling [Pseudobacteriovorax antillogorgiicola]SMF60246.1 7TM diverse intracellular signalling [Pseudobacteriovorax antillogorgiicola]
MKANGMLLKTMLWLTLTCLYGQAMPVQAASLIAKKGHVTVPIASLEQLQNIKGEWEFYYQEFLSPHELRSLDDKYRTYFSVPGKWHNNKANGFHLKGNSFGTYRLTLHFDRRPMGSVKLKIDEIPSAYRFFIDGELVVEQGKVAKEADSEQPKAGARVVELTPGDRSVELVFHTSSFNHYQGGTWYPLVIAKTAVFEQKRVINQIGNLTLTGGILIMGLFFLGLYLFIRREIVFLLISAICLTGIIRCSVAHGDTIAHIFFPDLSWHMSRLLMFSSFYLFVPVGMSLGVELLPTKLGRHATRVCWLFLPVFLALSLSGNTNLSSRMNIIPNLLTLCLVSVHLAAVIITYLPQIQRHMASIIGLSALVLTGFHDLLVAMDALASPNRFQNTLLIGLTLFVILQTLKIASQFARGESRARDSKSEVLRLNQQLEESIKLLNERLTEAGAKLIQREKTASLGYLTAGIAHELGTPLVNIENAFSKLDHKDGEAPISPKQITEFREGIETGIQHITHVVESLKLVAKPSESTPTSSVSIENILLHVRSLTKARFLHSDIRYQIVNHLDDDKVQVQAQESQICQIIINLLNNAFESLQSFRVIGPKVEIHVDQTFDSVLFTVMDNGRGIPEKIRSQIFDPFFTSKNLGEGVGLGLSMARSMAEQNQADLYLDETQANTAFVLKVPLAQEETTELSEVS